MLLLRPHPKLGPVLPSRGDGDVDWQSPGYQHRSLQPVLIMGEGNGEFSLKGGHGNSAYILCSTVPALCAALLLHAFTDNVFRVWVLWCESGLVPLQGWGQHANYLFLATQVRSHGDVFGKLWCGLIVQCAGNVCRNVAQVGHQRLGPLLVASQASHRGMVGGWWQGGLLVAAEMGWHCFIGANYSIDGSMVANVGTWLLMTDVTGWHQGFDGLQWLLAVLVFPSQLHCRQARAASRAYEAGAQPTKQPARLMLRVSPAAMAGQQGGACAKLPKSADSGSWLAGGQNVVSLAVLTKPVRLLCQAGVSRTAAVCLDGS